MYLLWWFFVSCSEAPASKWISSDLYQSDNVIGAKASKDSTNTWDEEEGKGIHKVAGWILLTFLVQLRMVFLWLVIFYGWDFTADTFYLQERLNQVLMEKKKESRSGLEIMNLLQVSTILVVWMLLVTCKIANSVILWYLWHV